MLTKFESKSARVKGLAFHPLRPWICASLHNGTIQLWDYRVGTIIDRFEEHDGPVRGVDFHVSQSLLVSGGDDYKVKVWDYKLRRCLFTLLGHLDYIRTVQFHPQPLSFPWILSASDDQTLRLWNYESRTCLSVLTGHNHYVMCASFHPGEDLIVSASLDQTVRVWDTAGLRKKHTGEGGSGGGGGGLGGVGNDVGGGGGGGGGGVKGLGGAIGGLNISSMIGAGGGGDGSGGGGGSAGSTALNVQAELFGTNDVVVKYVLEGHDRGVNWASFHPALPLIASAADDRQVKLWRMSETKAWEVDTLRGHSNNVSCCLFHPRHELIVSNSEDRSIRVWDVGKRVGVQTFRREGDRFWILAAHKTQNLLAAGHDSGMIVFKLERERPAHSCGPTPDKLYYVKGRELFCNDFSRGSSTGTGVDVPICTLRRVGQQAQTDGIGSGTRYLHYNVHNASEGNVLVCSDVDGGTYELVTFGVSSSSSGGGVGSGGAVTDGKRGSCMGPAIFLGRNRFATLDRHSRQISIKNLQNETAKRVAPPVPNVEFLMDGGTSGRLILATNDDRAILFEVQSRRVLGELSTPKLKFAIWAPDGSKVALVCKYGVVIANRQLEQLCSISDTVRIKSGTWDTTPDDEDSYCNLFVYTTLNHVKYVIPITGEGGGAKGSGGSSSADTGTIRTLDSPMYATRLVGDSLYCLDREARVRVVQVDATEAKFKLALSNKKYSRVMEMVRHSRLCGTAIVSYLQSKGFPEVALHFVREPRARFKLALDCGNIEAAMECAFTLESAAAGGTEVGAGGGGGGGVGGGLGGSRAAAEDKTREVWCRLGAAALAQGNHQVVEMAYQRTKDFDRLSFLYLMTGDTEKLRKMLKISNMRNDSMGRYHNALLLGDALERVKVLEHAGNLSLAFISAKIHNLEEDAERIKIAIETQEKSVEELLELIKVMGTKKLGCLLQPPTPIFRGDNWPTLDVPKTTLEDLEAAEKLQQRDNNKASVPAATEKVEKVASMDDDDFGDELKEDDEGAGDDDDFDMGDGGWEDDLDDFADDFGDSKSPTAASAAAAQKKDDEMMDMTEVAEDAAFQMPAAGRPAAGCWVVNSSHASDHMAAGSATSAMQLLNRQIAVANFTGNIGRNMVGSYLSGCASLPGIPGCPSLNVPLMRNDAAGHPGSESLPRCCLKMKNLNVLLRGGYRNFQGGKFNDAKACFLDVLHKIPLTVADNKAEALEMKDMVETCREYITAIRVKAAMSEHSDDPARSTELSAYFTHCNLQPSHLLLALRSAMGTSFRHKNFIVAASFARRLLELPDMNSERNAEMRVKVTKVLQKSESMARNQHTLNYDERSSFVLDCKTILPIYPGTPTLKCSYCGSSYDKEASADMENQICLTCAFCAVGVNTLGLITGS